MNKLRWYIKRLRVMQPVELRQRVVDMLRLNLTHVYYVLGSLKRKSKGVEHSKLQFCTAGEPQLPSLPLDFKMDESTLKQRLNGEYPALGFPWSWTANRVCWYRAPDTGRAWPQSFFGKINYRQGNPYGDARVIWEPGRLQQLFELALIARDHEDSRDTALRLLTDQLLAWVEQNPPGCGIHYISSMECALRILSVCYAVDTIRPYIAESSPVWHCVAILVNSHVHLIEGRLSLYSSSGNHTIAECSGLIYVGVLFPEIKKAAGWLSLGMQTLTLEADRQVLEDGGGIERSTWYHLFVIDLLSLVRELLVFKGLQVPTSIESAVHRGRKFLVAMANSPEKLPRFGDCDDGYALSPYLRLSWCEPKDQNPIVSFEETGYTVIETKSPVKSLLVLDHGPLGMPPSFGHGHADALSLWLSIGDQPLLVDPGTFTYTGDPEWRSYFKSTRAHNTIYINGRDQARQETAFQWSESYRAQLVERDIREDQVISIRLKHDGYVYMGLTHWRQVFILPERAMIIFDEIIGEGRCVSELYWQLDSKPIVKEDLLSFESPHKRISMQIFSTEITLHTGETAPLIGWNSPHYGNRLPITTVQSIQDGSLPHEFITTINFDKNNPVTMSEVNILIRDRIETLH